MPPSTLDARSLMLTVGTAGKNGHGDRRRGLERALIVRGHGGNGVAPRRISWTRNRARRIRVRDRRRIAADHLRGGTITPVIVQLVTASPDVCARFSV